MVEACGADVFLFVCKKHLVKKLNKFSFTFQVTEQIFVINLGKARHKRISARVIFTGSVKNNIDLDAVAARKHTHTCNCMLRKGDAHR